MAARKKISAREAAIKVLTDQKNKAMNINDIAKKALPLTALSGKNPIHGIRVQLVVGANKENGAFERTAKGMYRVRPSFLKAREAKAATPAPAKTPAKKNGNGAKAEAKVSGGEVATA